MCTAEELRVKSNPKRKSRQVPKDSLVAASPGDAPWDKNRGFVDDVANIYADALEFEKYAQRMNDCSGVLQFGFSTDARTGETRLRLKKARFCRVRYCPVCQWRRSLMWLARFYQSIPELTESYPKARWLFLTLTVRNCPIEQLGSTLTDMNKSWQRLLKRKEFEIVQGWIRTTEVTRGKDGSAHPHFHALLMVPPSYFGGGNYLSQARWTNLWLSALRADYVPIVDVRTIKPKEAVQAPDLQVPEQDKGKALHNAVAETLKYSVKPGDMIKNAEWFLELTRQTKNRRFLATGGLLKGILRAEQESDADLAMTDGPAQDDDTGERIGFKWRRDQRIYRRYHKVDFG